jgi:hypothetical protein
MTRDEYLRRVDFRLRDLPWATRRDLLAEIRGHLDELPADTHLGARLGTPEEYAAELRSAAGLERRHGPIAFLRARRPRNLILTALVLTLIGLAIGAVVWIDSYQPLAFGNGWRFPAGSRGLSGIEGESVVFRKGKPFELGFEVRNYGRYSVRVLSVPHLGPDPWTARLVMTRPNYSGSSAGPYERFRPFTLKARQSVFLLFKGVWACHTGMSAGGAFTYSRFPVRYRFLWRTTTTWINLPENLAIKFRTSCPPAKPGATTP